MKKLLIAFTAATTILFSACDGCKKPDDGGVGNPPTVQSVPLDSANKMVMSYLNSIDYQHEDSNLHCLIINADTLRTYLNTHQNIKKVKLMFAHTLDYINHGGEDQNAGYKANALTLVIVGYDAAGNYVYMPPQANPRVMDHCTPCPALCPAAGSAQIDTLVNLPIGDGRR